MASERTKIREEFAEELEEDRPLTKEELRHEIISTVVYLLVVFVLIFLFIHYVGQRTVVSGSSMENTLSNGDNLIIDKISYRFRDPERFEVVVFPYKLDEKTFFIKRVIGLPGETVYIDAKGTIYINGEKLEENYGREVIANPGLASSEITLAEDEYFVLGDNRNNSEDSRFDDVGNIKRSDLIGRAWVRIYPFSEMGAVNK
ncbi:MAG: signal peptidase I [Lachnospiraceae bacterium]|jgi:signal peptidase I|nr:signal peptidase I [Lachnospiraceae bacterium]MBR6281981.1 signal peptidase I [Lachnospiraceae bacterium]